MRIIDNRDKTISKAVSFVDKLSNNIYIFGTNKYGISLASWLKKQNKNIIGYIDDFTTNDKFNNYPILKSTSDFSDSSIINCVVEGRTIDIERLIKSTNAAQSIDYFSLQFAFSNELLQVDFLEDTNSVLDNINDYSLIYSILEDDISKNEFESLVNFRLNRDIDFLTGFNFRLKDQYFESFIQLESDATFIDAGGFDGGTSKLFAKLYPNYKKIYYFEPDKESFNKSIENLKDIDRIKYFNKGVWNKTETLAFFNTLGSANKISTNGNSNIEVISIDETIDEPVDYIKMDIEGAEYNALMGAKNHITKYNPVLAVCIYHNQADFIVIPKLVLSLNKKYKVYLRHYTQGVFETVMYFV